MNATYFAFEIKRIVRNPRFTSFAIAMPVAMYLLFAGIYGAEEVAPGVTSGELTMVNMAAYGAMSASLFAGTRIAAERDAGWQRQLRLTPLSGSGYLAVKAVSSVLVGLPVILLICGIAAAQGTTLSALQWTHIVLGLWLACLPFAALGILLGLFTTGSSVQAITGGIMMPLGMLGGLWVPLRILPHWMVYVAKAMPTYWMGEVGRSAVMKSSGTGIAAFVLVAWLLVVSFAAVRRFQAGTAR
ncbi:ABC transporter permease [Streptomyces sp. NPDC001250]|uniref:ABC transporter permease n=1 Tax=unclassified Streptomyces TaxID=2593676 RepID=UPI00331FF511